MSVPSGCRQSGELNHHRPGLHQGPGPRAPGPGLRHRAAPGLRHRALSTPGSGGGIFARAAGSTAPAPPPPQPALPKPRAAGAACSTPAVARSPGRPNFPRPAPCPGSRAMQSWPPNSWPRPRPRPPAPGGPGPPTPPALLPAPVVTREGSSWRTCRGGGRGSTDCWAPEWPGSPWWKRMARPVPPRASTAPRRCCPPALPVPKAPRRRAAALD